MTRKKTTKKAKTRAKARPRKKAAKKRTPKPKAEPRPPGRPTTYTPELAAKILARLPEESLTAICADPAMPAKQTVYGWVIDDREGFSGQYARARQLQALQFADDIIEIGDQQDVGEVVTEESKVLQVDGEDAAGQQDTKEIPVIDRKVVRQDMLGHRKLRIESRKWFLSKIMPQVFGERLMVGGDPDGAPIEISDVERAAKLKTLLELAERRKRAAEGEDAEADADA